MKLSTYVLFAGALLAQPTPEREVRQVIADFLTAFNNLDWASFRQCWTNNPVVFFPSLVPNSTGKRTETPDEFETAWRRQFDVIHDFAAKRGVTKPPFQHIEPRDLRIDFPIPNVAVVTFHLGPNNNTLGRRMLVLVRTSDEWKITHLHASNLSLSPN
jgi:SnoaL-like domain